GHREGGGYPLSLISAMSPLGNKPLNSLVVSLQPCRCDDEHSDPHAAAGVDQIEKVGADSGKPFWFPSGQDGDKGTRSVMATLIPDHLDRTPHLVFGWRGCFTDGDLLSPSRSQGQKEG